MRGNDLSKSGEEDRVFARLVGIVHTDELLY